MDDKTADENIVDGEIVESEAATPQSDGGQARPLTPERSDGGQATVLLNLEELVKNYIDSIEKITDALKQHRQMFADGLDNNPTYREVEAKVKEEDKKRLDLRQQILSVSSMRELAQKIKDMSSELREKKASLSDYLLEYQRMAGGVNEIEGHDGQIREIINSAKAVKKATRDK